LPSGVTTKNDGDAAGVPGRADRVVRIELRRSDVQVALVRALGERREDVPAMDEPLFSLGKVERVDGVLKLVGDSATIERTSGKRGWA
jgi:hypothetical protein